MKSDTESDVETGVDCDVSYYFGPTTTQQDRDRVARVVDYFNNEDKKFVAPKYDLQVAALADDISGVRSNRSPENPIRVTYKATKQILNTLTHIRTYVLQGNEQCVFFVRVDGSDWLQIV